MPFGVISPGAPEPLGAWPTANGVNVAVASADAAAIDACFFDADDREYRYRLPARTGDVFHGEIEGVTTGARYGLRAHGRHEPSQGLRFDASKLLLDPYAVALDRPLALHASLFAPPGEMIDSAPFMAKGIVSHAEPSAASKLVVPWDRTVIYEAHVRGLTLRHPDIPQDQRGTFAALAHPAIVAHLKALGITTLQLLPAAAWLDERHLPPLGLSNYWGYNPVAFCAPDPRLAPRGWADVRHATGALAEAGIEVILDVVFNHTGEGDAEGPTVSLRGLDNRSYYWLEPDDPARYVDNTGTGNTLRLDLPGPMRLVLDAMRTWVRRGGVNGFRFDLATVLGRSRTGFDPAAGLLNAIRQDPELQSLKLIAEPWDCGIGGYQLGRFPGPWAEWNDRFRDTARHFWKGDGANLGDLATRFSGSQDIFGPRHRPSRSINFVTAHDGFTLADLVSFEAKHNLANGEQNRDGTDNNISWNHGVEGASSDPQIVARRAADVRALLATLLLSRGTPMLAMGSELGHSQGGNNNAYAQDNETSWIDWQAADRQLIAFTQRLTRARLDHLALREDRFLAGEACGSIEPDVTWLSADGDSLQEEDWNDPARPALQVILCSSDRTDRDRVALLFNRGGTPLEALLPPASDGHRWSLCLDSADPRRRDGPANGRFEMSARSVAVLEEAKDPRTRSRGSEDGAVADLARAAGVATEWWSVDGVQHSVSPQTQRALLEAMGLPAGSHEELKDSLWRLADGQRQAIAPVTVVRQGQPASLGLRTAEAWLALEAESGAVTAVKVIDGRAELPDLPAGYFQARLGQGQGRLIVVPSKAYEPPGLAQGARIFGLSSQIYALRRAGDQGIGDLGSLRALGTFAAENGASMVAISPLHALFPQDRSRRSPYFPSDRRFIDPLYIDVAALPGRSAAQYRTTLPGGQIDYPSAWAHKADALQAAVEALERAGGPGPEFDRFCEAGGKALADFCVFQTLAESHRGASWTSWPEPLQDPDSPQVAAFAAARQDRVRHHALTQWFADTQLQAAAADAPGIGLCRDLAIGVAPDGAEAWSGRGRWAKKVSVGAPPDHLAPQGQSWGLPAPIPSACRAEGYEGFAELLRANLRHAGALRIDHILGLERLFWIPEGADGAEGAYVSYPRDDLLGVLALESSRAGALIIGEDLGTVSDELRGALRKAGVYGYGMLPFDRDGSAFRPPGAYRIKAVACVASHDLPPLAGWWDSADLMERVELGLLRPVELDAALARRSSDKANLLDALAKAGLRNTWRIDSRFEADLAADIHAFVALSSSQIALAQVEDLAGERNALNVPGTDLERKNWSLRLDVSLDAFTETETGSAILARMRAERPRLPPADTSGSSAEPASPNGRAGKSASSAGTL